MQSPPEVELMVDAIILQAVLDWRALIEGEDIVDVSFEELRCFFNGAWAAMLCKRTDPKYILRKLEEELERGSAKNKKK
jgi:hypothetical protein